MAKTGATADSGDTGRRAERSHRDWRRGKAMAQQEMKAAKETYSGFLSLLKVGAILTGIATFIVVLLIAS
ncbi:hypothetical protein [Sphingopyxis alaskensis]|uniref:hypothetical protein n=1 Tax=Sphingopyxis alaskensis TaxID=117207 RepID=UPI002040C72C|nr:hypothetical protein [Sphingopyxis alaskensis]